MSTVLPDLSLDGHVSNLHCHYVVQYYSNASASTRHGIGGHAVTLVQVLVASRVDYCNAVLASASKECGEDSGTARVLFRVGQGICIGIAYKISYRYFHCVYCGWL